MMVSSLLPRRLPVFFLSIQTSEDSQRISEPDHWGFSIFSFHFEAENIRTNAIYSQKLYEGHGYTIRSVPRTFITEILFIDWLETIVLLRMAGPGRNSIWMAGASLLLTDIQGA
jgi:hypothetical protein